MAIAWFLVGGFKNQIHLPGQLIFFSLVALSGIVGFGSLLILPRETRTAQSWVPVVGLLMFGACSGILSPVFASAKYAATRSRCFANVKAIGNALNLYTSDWDDRYPLADNWQFRIDRYLAVDYRNSRCGSADVPYTYAMNQGIANIHQTSLEKPNETITIFETSSQTPSPTGIKDSLHSWHGDRATIALADGHTTTTTRAESKYRWKP